MKTLCNRLLQRMKANIIACLALLLSLTGTAVATVIITSPDQVGDNTIVSRAIVDGNITTNDLANESVTKAKLAPVEALRGVGLPGQVAYNTYNCGALVCEWRDDGPGSFEFYKDPFGTVHLRVGGCWSARYNYQNPGTGECQNNDGGTDHAVFRLPAGYRPRIDLYFPPQPEVEDNTPQVAVGSGGSVSVNHFKNSSLLPSEIMFRAER